MSTGLGKWVFLIGAVIVVIALIRLLWKNYKHIREQKKIYLKYIGVRIITLLAVLVVFK